MSECVDDLRARGRRQVASHSIEGREVDFLLAHLTGKNLAWLIAHGSDELSAEVVSNFTRLMSLREEGQPLQYLTGSTEFYGREFMVDERVLIPRPETEFLIEESLRVKLPSSGTIVDVGTGSGCIAITLKLERPGLTVVAVDRSFDALLVARQNCRHLGARVHLVAGDVLRPIRRVVSMIVSNPPYIASHELSTLQREVQREPHMALSPGPDPYALITRLYRDGAGLLPPAAYLLMEIGFGQSSEVRAIAERCGWRVERVTLDLAGIDRIVVAVRVDAAFSFQPSALS